MRRRRIYDSYEEIYMTHTYKVNYMTHINYMAHMMKI